MLIPPSESFKSLARSYATCQETVVTSPLMRGFTEFIIIFGCSPLPGGDHTFTGAFASTPNRTFFAQLTFPINSQNHCNYGRHLAGRISLITSHYGARSSFGDSRTIKNAITCAVYLQQNRRRHFLASCYLLTARPMKTSNNLIRLYCFSHTRSY